jgi:hypothetical protein
MPMSLTVILANLVSFPERGTHMTSIETSDGSN